MRRVWEGEGHRGGSVAASQRHSVAVGEGDSQRLACRSVEQHLTAARGLRDAREGGAADELHVRLVRVEGQG
eukprot:2781241-Prymnesium_polylepis.1